MSNYTGTLIRVGMIFIFLMLVWSFLAFSISFLIAFLFSINYSLSILLYSFVAILVIRTFYPKFIFKN